MAGVNKVILVGNLGKDPEVRHIDSGATVANFSIATSESYKDRNGERRERTEWHNIVLWRGLAEIAEKYLRKGSQIYLEGRLQTRSWEDKEGSTRYTTEIVGTNLVMLGGRSNNESNVANKPSSTQHEGSISSGMPGSNDPDLSDKITDFNEDLKDDLPF